MKNLSASVIISLLLCHAITINAQSRSTSDTGRKAAIEAYHKEITVIENLALELSNQVAELPTGNIIGKQWAPLDRKSKQLISQCDLLENKPVEGYLDSSEKVQFKLHRNDFKTKKTLVKQTLSALGNYSGKYTLHRAQLIYSVHVLGNLISSCGNFRHFLLSLIPPVPDNLMKKISERMQQTDELINDNTRGIEAVSTAMQKELPLIASAVHTVEADTKEILRRLTPFPVDTLHNLALVNAYRASTFGIGYLRRVSGLHFAGAEVLVPVKSAIADRAGGLLFYGLQQKKFFMQVGIGYLKRADQGENLSWKAGLAYFPNRMGFGMSYSPLTGHGIQLSYHW